MRRKSSRRGSAGIAHRPPPRARRGGAVAGISGPQWLPVPRLRSSVSGPGPQRRRRHGSGPAFRRARIWLLHLLLYLLLCATRRYAPKGHTRQSISKISSLLRTLGGPRRAAGSAECPIARLLPACSGGGRAAGMTADRICIRGCAVSWSRRRTALRLARRAVIRTWTIGDCSLCRSCHYTAQAIPHPYLQIDKTCLRRQCTAFLRR